MVREAVDQGDRAGRVGKDGVPLLKEQVRGHDDGALLVSATDDLKQQVRGVGVVGEVPDLVNGQNLRPGIGAQSALQRARGVLAVQIEQEVRRGDEARRVARQHRLVQQVS